MSKLKRLINQLSEEEFRIIHHSLIEGDAEKSADLLKYFQEGLLTDKEVKDILGVNNNAFYTLRSRLNEKIETFFLQQMESPRTNILKQVVSINEVILTKKRTIAIATLKKLEKELLDYDLSNELTIVYKALKKLHLHDDEYYEYSQRYNKHVAYMLAIDKAEDRLIDYFKDFNKTLLSYQAPEDVMTLGLYTKEINSVFSLYKSHRLFVFKSCNELFNILYVSKEKIDEERIDQILADVDKIFITYNLDTLYSNLKWVFEYMCMLKDYRLENYNIVDKALKKLSKVLPNLITNYSCFTAAPYALIIRMERAIALGLQADLKKQNSQLFKGFEIDVHDTANYVHYMVYRALSCAYANDYEGAIEYIETLIDKANIREYTDTSIDVKLLLIYFYIKISDFDKANFMINNVQRLIRLTGKDACEHSYVYMKILKSALAELEIGKKEKKMINYVAQFKTVEVPFTSPIRLMELEMFNFNIDELDF